MKIGIIGVGFVGGATAEVFKKVHDVYLYDRYKKPYNGLGNIEAVARNSEVIFLSVPTPMQNSGAIDYEPINHSLSFLTETAKAVGRNPKDIVVTVRSTAVSGTTDALSGKYSFKFAFNPEFLKERTALEDMLNTNRIVIGANDAETRQAVKNVYLPLFPEDKVNYIMVTTKEAEMIKYAANVMLAVQIAGANEIYQICQAAGIEYDAIKKTILLDERIGMNIDVPGPDGDLGFGGKCFPKDLNALIYFARHLNYRPYFLEEAWRLNEKVRKNKDWLNIAGAVSENKDFKNE